MAKYKILTPNPQYNGVTEGLGFVNGVAETDSEILKNVLVNNYGYNVETQKQKAEVKETPKQAPTKAATTRKTSGK